MAKNKTQNGSNYQAENCHDSMGGQDRAGQNKSSNKSTNRSSNKSSDKMTDKATDKMSDSY